ncbi:MAG: methionine--tRNA ligase [Elusimicrobia bacterium]|nr:methionine--tRNA ligase [Elusimicrobiota bacterium]
MNKTFYITTPIYYVNDVPHIGHAYTTIAADVLARWKRLRGENVFYLTGTDEHGSKIVQAASDRGQTPQAYTDHVVGEFQRLWKRLNISNDDFIRTTSERHEKVVQAAFEKMRASGDIYMGTYEDWYCVPCETFWSESELAEGKCPDCARPVEKLKEDSYFFRLSKYERPLLEYYEKNPGFLAPSFRASEISNFVKSGLRDLSVSRVKVKWGVPIPSDSRHTIYVWFDALLNYISAPGYLSGNGVTGAPFETIWPADVHLVGKEIFRFHSVIWPAMLMSLGLPLPKQVFAHGWWTVEGDKMSKSKGNVVNPHRVADEYGVDPLRYFVLREVPFGGDGDFSQRALLGRYNAELANALGNLLNRTLNLVEKNNGSKVPGLALPPELLNQDRVRTVVQAVDSAMDRLAFHEALQNVIDLVNACNKYMDDQAPWKTAKTDLPAALRSLHEVLRVLKFVAVLLQPVMPSIALEMWKQLGETGDLPRAGAEILRTGAVSFQDGQTVQKGAPLFPRKDVNGGN